MQLFDDDFIAVNGNTKGLENSASLGTFPTPSPQVNGQTGQDFFARQLPKACLFTLVAYARDFEELIQCQKLIRLISKKFPCKILFVHVDPTLGNTFQKEHHAFKNISQGSNNVICELISIQVSPDLLPRVPFSILPEIVPDLPLYLLLGAPPKEGEHIFETLMPYVTKIIFEPTQITQYGNFADEILGSPRVNKYIDLNWVKLKPWREALFRIFDDASKLESLRNAATISIRYARHAASQFQNRPDTQAVYLQSWLAERLDWNLENIEERDDRLHLFYKNNQTHIEIDITPYDSPLLEEGSVSSIEIHGAGDTHYLINYENDDRHIVVHSSSPDRCEMPFVLFVGSFQRGHLMMNELFRKTSSINHYALMVQELQSHEWRTKRIYE